MRRGNFGLGVFAAAALALRGAGENELRNLARFSCDAQALLPVWLEAIGEGGKPCVRVLTRVGGEQAIAVLTRYSTVPLGRGRSLTGALTDARVTSGH